MFGNNTVQLSFSATMPPERVTRPSLIRGRNLDVTLSLRDRVLVTKAYKTQQSYESLANQFNCSVNEIKNIHRRGKQRAIRDYVKKNIKRFLGIKQVNSGNDILVATFLNKFVYEWFQRAQRRPDIGKITNTLILRKAEEAKRMLPFKEFTVDLNWVLQFRVQHHITDLEMTMLMIKDDDDPIDLDIDEIAMNVLDQYLTSTQAPTESLSDPDDSDVEFVIPDITKPQLPEEMSTNTSPIPYNKLSLRDRIRVVNAYKDEPSYNILAKQFNCSFIEIRNIHRRGRQRVYTEYIKVKTKEYLGFRYIKAENDLLVIPFLEKLIYEWVQRAQRHAQNGSITNKLILMKAEEAIRILPMKDYTVDLDWVKQFRYKYNITDVDMAMLKIKDDNEPMELNMNEIAVYILDQDFTPCLEGDPKCSNEKDYQELELLEQDWNASHHDESIADEEDGADRVNAMELEMPPIQNDADVQRYLKPLEDYALIKENFRAIGLIEQLRDILKHDTINNS